MRNGYIVHGEASNEHVEACKQLEETLEADKLHTEMFYSLTI